MRIQLQNKADWHRWFAWCPIRLNNEIIWLECVERRFTGNFNHSRKVWAYRACNL